MSTTFDQGIDELRGLIDDSGSTTKKSLTRFLNLAANRVARARDWPEVLRRSFVTLGAPYSAGVIAITSGTKALTGTGTLWSSQTPALDAQYKFALGYGMPFYAIAAPASDTGLVLLEDYLEATQTAGEYVLFKDVVSLPAGCNKVVTARIHGESNAPELRFTESPVLHGWGHYPRGEGRPTRYALIERDSAGNMQMRVGPVSPDRAYRVEVLYRKNVTEGKLAGDNAGGDNVVLDEDRFELILQYALYWAKKRDKAAAAQELAIYRDMLNEHWGETDEVEDSGFVLPTQRVGRRGYSSDNYRDLES